MGGGGVGGGGIKYCSLALTSPNCGVAEHPDGLLALVVGRSLGVRQAAALRRWGPILVEAVLVRAGRGDHGDVPAAYLSPQQKTNQKKPPNIQYVVKTALPHVPLWFSLKQRFSFLFHYSIVGKRGSQFLLLQGL